MADPYSGPPLRMSERTAHDTLQRLAVHLAGDGGGAAAHRLDKAALRDGGHRGVADGPHGGEVPDTFICTAGSEREPKVKSVLFRLREAEEAEPDEEALVTLLRTVHSCW